MYCCAAAIACGVSAAATAVGDRRLRHGRAHTWVSISKTLCRLIFTLVTLAHDTRFPSRPGRRLREAQTVKCERCEDPLWELWGRQRGHLIAALCYGGRSIDLALKDEGEFKFDLLDAGADGIHDDTCGATAANVDLDLDKRRDLFSNDAYRDVESYNYVASALDDATRGTGSTAEPDRRLDYVFASPELLATAAGPWKGRRAGDMDHDPVVVDLTVAPEREE